MNSGIKHANMSDIYKNSNNSCTGCVQNYIFCKFECFRVSFLNPKIYLGFYNVHPSYEIVVTPVYWTTIRSKVSYWRQIIFIHIFSIILDLK